MCKALWTLLRGSLMYTSILSVFPSHLPGVNPATLNGTVLYYRLMTKWSGSGDSTELSRMGFVTPRVFAQCQIVLITHFITPINHLDDHRSTLGQNPSSKPLLFP
jgi:hypothetical protein